MASTMRDSRLRIWPYPVVFPEFFLSVRSTRHVRRPGLLWRVSALLLAAGMVLMAPAPADAHAELIGSSPASGSVRAMPPTEVTLTFSEPVAAEFTSVSLSVGGRRGVTLPVRQGVTSTSVAAAVTTAVGQHAAPVGSPTLWRVNYRVTSDDGHPIQGVIEFVVDPGRPSKGTASAAPEFESHPSIEVEASGRSGSRLTSAVLVVVGLAAIAAAAVVQRTRREAGEVEDS